MGNFLSKMFSAGATNLIDAVGNAIDKNVTSDDERLERANEAARDERQYKLEATGQILEDIDSARVNNSRVQESAHSSWLAKNIQPFLGLMVVFLTFGMFWWFLSGGSGEIESESMKAVKNIIIGILGTILVQVIAYYFGSSQGSKDKQTALSGIIAKK